MLSPATAPGPDDVVRARGLREVLRPLGLAAAAGRTPEPGQVEALNAVLVDDAPLRLTPHLAVATPPTAAAVAVAVARP